MGKSKSFEDMIDKNKLNDIDSNFGLGSGRYSFKDEASAREFIKSYNEAIKAKNSALRGDNLYELVIKPKLIDVLGSRYVATLPLGIQIDAAIYSALLWISKEKKYFHNKKEGIRKSWEKYVLSEGEKDLINLDSRIRVNQIDASEYLQNMFAANKLGYADKVIENGIKMVDCILRTVRYCELMSCKVGASPAVHWDSWGLDNPDAQVAFSEIALAEARGKIVNKNDLLDLALTYLDI